MGDDILHYLNREMEKEMATHSGTGVWDIPWQKSLVGYSLWGCTESDTTEHTHTHTLNSESPVEKSMRPLFLSESATSPLMNASFY